MRSSPTPSLSRQQVVSLFQSSCVSPVELTDRRKVGRGWARSPNIRRRQSLALYKLFNGINTLWDLLWMHIAERYTTNIIIQSLYSHERGGLSLVRITRFLYVSFRKQRDVTLCRSYFIFALNITNKMYTCILFSSHINILGIHITFSNSWKKCPVVATTTLCCWRQIVLRSYIFYVVLLLFLLSQPICRCKHKKGKNTITLSCTYVFDLSGLPYNSWTYTVMVTLKVHKIENFFDSDFGICVISLLVMSKY